METLHVFSPSFKAGGLIPIRHTGYGDDVSPALQIEGLSTNAVSIAVLLNDMSHPIPAYNHWLIWNLPAESYIPENIPYGEKVEKLGNAVQGRGYGKHRYRGPKPPFKWSHIYQYQVFVLDCTLELPSSSRKKDLLTAMDGHILQQAELSGHYR